MCSANDQRDRGALAFAQERTRRAPAAGCSFWAIASVRPFAEFDSCRRSEPIVSKRSVISAYVRQALAGTRRFG
jgi:hypothetical protein